MRHHGYKLLFGSRMCILHMSSEVVGENTAAQNLRQWKQWVPLRAMVVFHEWSSCLCTLIKLPCQQWNRYPTTLSDHSYSLFIQVVEIHKRIVIHVWESLHIKYLIEGCFFLKKYLFKLDIYWKRFLKSDKEQTRKKRNIIGIFSGERGKHNVKILCIVRHCLHSDSNYIKI